MSSSCPYLWQNVMIWGMLSQDRGLEEPYVSVHLSARHFAQHFICTNFGKWPLLLSQIRKEGKACPADQGRRGSFQFSAFRELGEEAEENLLTFQAQQEAL